MIGIYDQTMWLSVDEESDSFEIDVKPKQKNFSSAEEKQRYVQGYLKKKKTELCKNYQLMQWCKFGDACSFAHGEQELAPKVHLHQKYKTKPCQKYFREGYCSYGIRCQYVHDEIRNIDSPSFWTFYEGVQHKAGLSLPTHPSQLNPGERFDLQRFQALNSLFDGDLELFINPNIQRPPTLCNLTRKLGKKNLKTKRILSPRSDSTDISRRNSEHTVSE